MRNTLWLILATLSLCGCAGMPPNTFEAPLQPIPFPVSASSLTSAFVQDQRPDDQRVTQTIREFSTTTLLIGDNFLTPAPPILLASKLLERDPRFDQAVTLRISHRR
jgi:hypothetical protein